jgi:hypothetical protein
LLNGDRKQAFFVNNPPATAYPLRGEAGCILLGFKSLCFGQHRHFAGGITQLALWAKTRPAIKLAFQAVFVENTSLAETSVNSVLSVAKKIREICEISGSNFLCLLCFFVA